MHLKCFGWVGDSDGRGSGWWYKLAVKIHNDKRYDYTNYENVAMWINGIRRQSLVLLHVEEDFISCHTEWLNSGI